jgi:ABC-2 type transport system permease protein
VRNIWILSKREFSGYFITPVAYVFIFFFLVFMGVMPWAKFGGAGFFERGQADLGGFFNLHPWLYLFLIPAISMRLWAEERRSGTIELLMTLPVSVTQCVVGKFLAAWAFCAVALALTFPIWLTVNYLGEPDNGVVVASYIGSLLLAGGYLAIGAFISSWTKNQVIAFVLTFVVGFGFVFAGTDLVLGWVSNLMPESVVDAVRSFSFLGQMEAITKGVLDVRSLAYFASLIVCSLAANAITLDLKKAN